MTKEQAQNLLGVLERVGHMHGVINTPAEALVFAEAVTALRNIVSPPDAEDGVPD